MKKVPYEESLEYKYPQVASEWHPTRNGDLKPYQISAISTDKVWWYLSYDDLDTGKHFNFEWKSSLRTRTVLGIGCPYISGHTVWRGYNDLETLYPEIAKEWHPTKNGDLKPYEVAAKANKRVWWYLPYDDPVTGKHFDFEWESYINNRVKQNLGCPYLSSKAVWSGYNDLETLYPEIAKEWHPTKNGDLQPSKIMPMSHRKVWWYLSYDDPETGKHFDFEWQCSIVNRVKKKFNCPYISGHAVWRGYNDLETLYPEIAKEWNFTKNGDLKPYEVTAKTNKRVWWHLPYDDPVTGRHFDFEWSATIVERVVSKCGCPYISGHRVWKGYNDLQTVHPEIAKDWHPTKNGDISPSYVYCESKKKYWWYLSYDDPVTGKQFDFEWRQSIMLRNRNKGNCPYLSGDRVWKGYNDLETFSPEIAEEWNATKNKNKLPSMYCKFSNAKVWWKCKNNHEWRASIISRTNLGSGCPDCKKANLF